MISFKMIGYNIMSGCFENYNFDSKLTPRFELLKKAIKDINADFIGLVDTYKWKESFLEEFLKEQFGYKHIFCIDMEDDRVEKNIGITVMTNLDVKEFNIIRAHTRNFIETVLDGLSIYTCYLDDLSEDVRLLQIKSLLNTIKTPSIIHGDLNSYSLRDLQKESILREKFIYENKELYLKLQPLTDEMERGEVIKTLEDFGFIDPDKIGIPTMPTKLFPANTVAPFVRVDYLMHTKDITVSNIEVPNTELLNKISDHLPLIAEVKLSI